VFNVYAVRRHSSTLLWVTPGGQLSPDHSRAAEWSADQIQHAYSLAFKASRDIYRLDYARVPRPVQRLSWPTRTA
jgi:hypothetical protein